MYAADGRGFADEATRRVLRFPEDRSLGELKAQYAAAVRHAAAVQPECAALWMHYRGWKPLGRARGAVTVPAGHHVVLHLYSDACKDLSSLAKLKPDDLYGVQMNWHTARGVPYNNQLVHLANLRDLRCLTLSTTNLTATRLSELQELRHLERLSIGRMNGNDDLIRQISTFQSLKALYLEWSQEPLSLKHLANLPKLEMLSLFSCLVTDEMAEDLVSLRNLKSLRFDGTMLWLSGGGNKLTDTGFARISRITPLESLAVAGGRPTFKSVEHLSKLENLRELSLERHSMSTAGRQRLDMLQKVLEERRRVTQSPDPQHPTTSPSGR